MENKKQKTTLKEVRKRMKKLTLAEKKQIIKKESKEAKERKEASKQKITQRVKVNLNIGGSNIPPYPLYNQPPSGNFPNSFYNREQATLLKSINEQLKQKNEPVPISQTFNIPEPKQTYDASTQMEPKKTYEISTQMEPKKTYEYSTQTEPKKTYEYSTQTEQKKPKKTQEISTQVEPKQTYEYSTQTEQKKPKQTYEYSTQTEQKKPKQTYEYSTQTEQDEPIKKVFNDDESQIFFENMKKERELLERRLKNIPPQFSEKVETPPIFLPKQVESIPIVNKPIEKSGLSLVELMKKMEERNQRSNDEVKKMEEKLTENKSNIPEGSKFIQELKQKVEEKKNKSREMEQMEAEETLMKQIIQEEKRKQKEMEAVMEQQPETEKGKAGRKKLADEIIKEREQMKAEETLMKQIIKEDKRKQKELEAEMERRRKLNEAENQKQRITEKAFLIVLDNVSVEEQKRLQEAYDTGFLKDKEIKALLKKLKYTPEQVKRIYSTDI